MSNFYSFEIRLGPAGRSDYFFLKLKRRRFRKKNKNQRVSAEFLTQNYGWKNCMQAVEKDTFEVEPIK